MYKFVNENNLITEHQSGFRPCDPMVGGPKGGGTFQKFLRSDGMKYTTFINVLVTCQRLKLLKYGFHS